MTKEWFIEAQEGDPLMTKAHKEWTARFVEIRANCDSALDALKRMNGITFGGITFTLDLSPEAIFVQATNARGDVITERVEYCVDGSVPNMTLLGMAEAVMTRART